MLFSADKLPASIISKASNNAITFPGPIFPFNCEHRTWKTWPHICFTFTFDSITHFDFGRMCTYAVAECNANTGKKSPRHCVSLGDSTGCRISIPFSSPQKSSYLFLPFSWGICIMDFFFPAICVQSEREKVQSLTWTHTHVLAGVLVGWVISKQKGSMWMEIPVNTVKGGQKKRVGHAPAQSVSCCLQWDTPGTEKWSFVQPKTEPRIQKTSNSHPITKHSLILSHIIFLWMPQTNILRTKLRFCFRAALCRTRLRWTQLASRPGLRSNAEPGIPC